MLIIERRKNQSIRVGPIEISILKIKGGIVKLGITGPRNITVRRSEDNRERENDSCNHNDGTP